MTGDLLGLVRDPTGRRLLVIGPVVQDRKIVALDACPAWQYAHDRSDRRLVFTNGCHDILHAGHVSNLSRSKELGDLLVVGVNGNGNDSVRRLKGPERPLTSLDERLRVRAALNSSTPLCPSTVTAPRTSWGRCAPTPTTSRTASPPASSTAPRPCQAQAAPTPGEGSPR
ncbi:adenylyltransferase/cytidyltransferase family protein [Streptomyces massasporeus]|uniref:adenylyltransferase/cytidyltransferase family protein n=1 Tax=Streptomyces massasporeus TaxID=67324 RepID=UPI0036FFB5EE